MNKPNIPTTILAGWKVVVIDDEPDSLMVAEIMLAAFGASVTTASNGIEGLAKVREVMPRLVVSDLSMPVMDGWTFIKELRTDASLAPIPVIALTAHAMQGDREKALEAGFTNYLTKPLSVETFIPQLVNVLKAVPVFAEDLKSLDEE